MSHNFRSIAFPAIGCGKHGCSVKTVVKTMVEEMKKQLIQRNQNWTVKFVIQPNQGDVYDEFCKQVLKTEDGKRTPPMKFRNTERISNICLNLFL